jgi:hypothetical protein
VGEGIHREKEDEDGRGREEQALIMGGEKVEAKRIK